jgi:hypothetical protein
MRRQAIACCVVVASLQCCLGQLDPNILSVGEWSAPVADAAWPLRGRLLIYGPESEGQKQAPGLGLRIYLELQHVADSPRANKLAMGVFTRSSTAILFEMRDGHDKPAEERTMLASGPPPYPFSVTLPPDSTLRLRVPGVGARLEREGLLIWGPGTRGWLIRSGDTHDYYLSGTLSLPKTNQSDLDYHPWQGTLHLPKVRIPVKKLMKR